MIAIRFDDGPGPIAGRFIEVERDGASIKFGDWKQDGDDWLLELTEVDQLEAENERLRRALDKIEQCPISSIAREIAVDALKEGG